MQSDRPADSGQLAAGSTSGHSLPRRSRSVAEAGEHALIERVRQRLGPSPDWLLVDVGDDAAVYEPVRGLVEVITTDAIVDGVHFDRRFVPARAIGHRALAVNLSDLAAMGATPRLATLSLVLPPDLPLADFDEMIDGLLALATESRTRIVGGNVTSTSGPLAVDVTLIGAVHRRRVLTRGGARPGERPRDERPQGSGTSRTTEESTFGGGRNAPGGTSNSGSTSQRDCSITESRP